MKLLNGTLPFETVSGDANENIVLGGPVYGPRFEAISGPTKPKGSCGNVEAAPAGNSSKEETF